MAGVVGVGNMTREFAGEMLDLHATSDGTFFAIEAIYGVHLRNRSFTALIRGGQNNAAGTAILDGVSHRIEMGSQIEVDDIGLAPMSSRVTR